MVMPFPSWLQAANVPSVGRSKKAIREEKENENDFLVNNGSA
jgi:hypothetical protein